MYTKEQTKKWSPIFTGKKTNNNTQKHNNEKQPQNSQNKRFTFSFSVSCKVLLKYTDFKQIAPPNSSVENASRMLILL